MREIIICLYNYLSEHFSDKNGWVEFGVINQAGLRLHIPVFFKRNIVSSLNIYKSPEFLLLYPKVEIQQDKIDNFNRSGFCFLLSGVFFRPLLTIYCCCIASFYFRSAFSVQNAVHIELW